MKKLNKVETLFRYVALAILATLAFAGVFSLLPTQTDTVVRYTIAGVVVFWLSKELW